MGRSYWFECLKCGYRAKVSGRADRGLSFSVQTILCRDCRELYDAVVRLRVLDELGGWGDWGRLRKSGRPRAQVSMTEPPVFQAALNRLPPTGPGRFKWLAFKPQCPFSTIHRVRSWTDSGPMPEVRQLSGEERPALPALGLRCHRRA